MKTCDVCGRIGGAIFDGGVVADVQIGILNVKSVEQEYGKFFDLCGDCIQAVDGRITSMMTELKEEKCLGKHEESVPLFPNPFSAPVG